MGSLSRILLLLPVLFSLYFTTTKAQLEPITVNADLQLIPLSDSLFIHRSWHDVEPYGRVASNGILLVRAGEALMVDTPMDETKTAQLYHFVKDSLQAKITLVIPGHFHADCTGGLSYLHQQGARSIANNKTIDICRQQDIPVPLQGFGEEKEIDFNGIPIELYYPGPGHSEDNIVVFFPTDKILFGGCLVRPASAKGLGNTADANLKEWGNTARKVYERFPGAHLVVPGHGRQGDLGLLRHTIEQAKNAGEKF